ncbi:MAG: hemerythrin domain-containing protein [Magnetococcales bacterium]|nr:hemerythrin domain-containing protein [Magnetococcales bacterium]
MATDSTSTSKDGFLRVFSLEDFRQTMYARLRDVGIPALHGQHVGLVEIMVSLYGEVKKLQKAAPGKEDLVTLRRAIDELKSYATRHFQEEEAYMKNMEFPAVHSHIAAHQAFVGGLLEVENRIWKESVSYVIDLLHLIVGWLFEHINQMDMVYARFSRGEKVTVPPLARSAPVALPAQPKAPDGKTPDGRKSASQAEFRDSLRRRLRMTGIAPIDKEHQQLLERIIDLNLLVEELSLRKPTAKDWQVIDRAIHFLHNYGRDHFRGEEAWMRNVGYPGLAVHADEHKRLLTRLQDLAAKLAKDRQVLYIVDMNFFLVEWLLTHTVRSDFLYVEFAKSRNISKT